MRYKVDMAVVKRTRADAKQPNPKPKATSCQETGGNIVVGKSLHVKNFKEACLVLPRPFPSLFSAKSHHGFCSGVFTLAGYRYRDATCIVAGTRAKNREREA